MTEHTHKQAYLAATSYGVCIRQPLTAEQVKLITPYDATDKVDFFKCTDKFLILAFSEAGVQEFQNQGDTLQVLAKLKGSDTYWCFEAADAGNMALRIRAHVQWIDELAEIMTKKQPVDSFDQYQPEARRLLEEDQVDIDFLLERQLYSLGLELEAHGRQKDFDHSQTLEAFMSHQFVSGDDFLTLLSATPYWYELSPTEIIYIQHVIHQINTLGMAGPKRFRDNDPLVVRLAGKLTMYHMNSGGDEEN